MRLALIFGLGLCLALLLSAPAAAFNGQRVTEGPLTLVIEKVQPLDALGKPHPVQVSLANAGTSELAVTVELFGLADEFRAEGPARFELRIPPAGKSKTGFQIVAGPGIHRALYPVHVRARFQQEGQPRVAEAVEIFAADLPRSTADAAGSAEVTTVTQGATPLSTLKNHRVFWSYLDGDQPEVGLPLGWLGTDETSRASCQWDKTARGEMKTALRMHPAYRPKAGLVQIEYRLQLPKIEPLHLSFANAIRDNGPKEPASDGVTFRVLIDGKQVFERHSDSKVWVPGDVDLSPWAGQQVRLRLESHPGPKRSTTCDSSFWGDPVVIAGQPPKLLSEPQKAALAQQVRQALLTGQTKDPQVHLFPLADGARAAVGLGGCGLADGWLGFAVGERLVLVEGMHVAVLDQTLGVWPSALACDATQITRPAAGRLKLVQDLRLATESFPLTTEVWAEGAGLRVKVDCPQRITDLAPGAADQLAPRVYYGHGYCIQDPQRFTASAGGHNLATSHVGFDFASGLSLLMATDTPPDTLRVDPELRQYSLHVHPDAMFTFVPSARGALDCAVKYRPLYDKQAAGGVARKAGRFVFDLWGGTYAGNDDLLRKAFAYGLTDAMVILHSWQRWGYDYRLPDIFPPNPEFGTQEELRALGDECRRQGVLWGLHDNYIDFYPDAGDYSYEHICFTKDGNPQKAWINQGRDAQSYRFRPDRIQPFVQRNVRLIKDALAPDNYFLDVFAAVNSFDYYDRQGRFHSKMETRQAWGKAFDTIRDTLGNAPTSSEAGGDHLIGHLDGADCQFLRLSPEARRYRTVLQCKDWDRVPWFDAVNHTRFSLHGVGYSHRYSGGYSRALHGIESDDYLTSEILTGHALMVDRPAMGRPAVRKYWLAQDFIRSLAQDEMISCELPGGDIHRTITRWKSGAVAYVNRSGTDWTVQGHVLPQYGYWASNGAIQSGIQRIGGAIVEQSQSQDCFYVDGRGFLADAPLQIQPRAKSVEYLGNRQFKFLIDWDVKEKTARDLDVCVHFYKPQTSRLVLVGFQGKAGRPTPPTNQWEGRVTTGQSWITTIPEDCPPGEYEITAGMLDDKASGDRRVRVWGEEDGNRRCRLGTLVVEGDKQGMTGLRIVPAAEPDLPKDRLLPNPQPIDFATVVTRGAVRCQVAAQRLTITPAPGSESFGLALRLEKILGRPAKVRTVQAVDEQGKTIRQVDFHLHSDQSLFTTEPGEFAYQVELE